MLGQMQIADVDLEDHTRKRACIYTLLAFLLALAS